MMKLTVVVLFCLIAATFAHGTGGYRPYGGAYGGGNGGGGRPHESSSSSEEDPKKCKLICTTGVSFLVFLDRVPTTHSCNSGSPEGRALQCGTCCQGWGLQKGVHKDNVVSHVTATSATDVNCICCERKCR